VVHACVHACMRTHVHAYVRTCVFPYAVRRSEYRPYPPAGAAKAKGRRVLTVCPRAGDCSSMMRVRLVVAEKATASLIKL